MLGQGLTSAQGIRKGKKIALSPQTLVQTFSLPNQLSPEGGGRTLLETLRLRRHLRPDPHLSLGLALLVEAPTAGP